ncbi:MAG: RNA polymerase sigma factor (sigma-70 family) [Roseivirga sp.]
MFFRKKLDIAQVSDFDLIALYQQKGDNEVIGELYKRYMSLVYGLCLKYLKDREVAKDMTMQVFEKLLSRLKDQEVAHFKGWLFVLSKNECLMYLRKQKSQGYLIENGEGVMEIASAVHHESEPNALENDLTMLESCISQLNIEQQACIRFFYIEKKCYQEVVDLTGFDLKKVKSYIQNGRRNLKICVENLREREA